MNNNKLLKKLIELNELDKKNIKRMGEKNFLINMKYKLETFYFSREMSNLMFYSLIKECLGDIEINNIEIKNNENFEKSIDKQKIIAMLENKIQYFNKRSIKNLFLIQKNGGKTGKTFMENLITLLEIKISNKFEMKLNELENKYGKEVLEMAYENELETEDIISNWKLFEAFLEEYLII